MGVVMFFVMKILAGIVAGWCDAIHSVVRTLTVAILFAMLRFVLPVVKLMTG